MDDDTTTTPTPREGSKEGAPMDEQESRRQWKARVGSEESGAVDLEVIQHWARVGRLAAHDLVFNPETGAWVPARNVVQLAGLFSPLPEEKRRSMLRTPLSARPALLVILGGVVFLAILAWLLSSIRRDGRYEPARRAACVSNLKQIGLGLTEYAQDFDNAYPWQVGGTAPGEAWRDLGLLYPSYITAIGVYLCPSSKDRKFEPMSPSGPKDDYPFQPFRDHRKERISYAYCLDARDPERPTSWTENAPSGVRLVADKKAGLEIGHPDNLPKRANHKGEGRNVLYQDGHVKWKSGIRALDPEPDDDAIGPPDAKEYVGWWSDPPYYGE